MINIVVVFEVRTFRVMIRITGIEHDSPVFHITRRLIEVEIQP